MELQPKKMKVAELKEELAKRSLTVAASFGLAASLSVVVLGRPNVVVTR